MSPRRALFWKTILLAPPALGLASAIFLVTKLIAH